ncbi:Mrp/NBP35 family ATP-binding protein [Aristaeella lactis]|uniref:Chromosome partitioning ATPase, Mrp family, contains Fe-S cluster n=1 Tax=Aristaeella lactis TaxID=3046383 RepID=A0AC61PNF0_9FIRM|nr:Mrp/NBP35 family ATP-binding protein [Aristaeella lactis]QUA52513.1 Mrp/NBP35 family ATP-binding protein [Aristaeella lactis]SMC76615.1 Chromosome partitioning ATPase, Mrp family, contains Fe-S cluster [Aristaeella lactis]
MSECTHDCSSCGADCASRNKPESLLEAQNAFSNVKKVIAVVSGKGGVGKSLVTGLLSVLTKRNGHSTAILDADITGPSIPKMFGVHDKAMGTEDGILPVESRTGVKMMSVNLLLENDTDPVIWRGALIAGTVKQFWTDVLWGDVDYMFVDMPPGTGDVPLTVFQSLPVDGIIIVTSPQELVGMIVEKAAKMAKMMNIPVLGLVENMSWISCPDCGKKIFPFGESQTAKVALEEGIPLLAQLPIDPALARECDTGVIELFNEDWMDPVISAVENCPKRVINS